MRTTLTIDEDIAIILQRLRRARNKTFKELVNEALRRGLRDMNDRPRRPERFRTTSVALGRIRSGVGIDNIAEILAIAEGEGHK
jgi:hypothetical protein